MRPSPWWFNNITTISFLLHYCTTADRCQFSPCKDGGNQSLILNGFIEVEYLGIGYYGIIYILFILNKWKVTTAGFQTSPNHKTRVQNTAQPASVEALNIMLCLRDKDYRHTLRQTGQTLLWGPGSSPWMIHCPLKWVTTLCLIRQCGSNLCPPGLTESPSRFQAPTDPIWCLPKLSTPPPDSSNLAQPATSNNSKTHQSNALSSTHRPLWKTCSLKAR